MAILLIWETEQDAAWAISRWGTLAASMAVTVAFCSALRALGILAGGDRGERDRLVVWLWADGDGAIGH